MATISTANLNAQYKAKEIDLNLIDPPEVPERETMEEIPLAELALNIQQVGLIKPLIVKQVGDRYEVIAGHRRMLACGLVKYSPVPCRVLVKGKVDMLAILVSENAHTEAVNPVEEARFYARLLEERCGNDVDALCIAVKKRREYVEDRLLLLSGYPKVMEALQRKEISFAVARELNKVSDPMRLLQLLDVAINQGASARQVVEWRKQFNLVEPLLVAAAELAGGDAQTVEATKAYVMQCMFCEGTEDPHLMQMIWLHKHCQTVVQRMLQIPA